MCGIMTTESEVRPMGIYVNAKNTGFQEATRSEIYIDKTMLIAYTNKILGTMQKNICISRPRRFGKSMAAQMLAAYYGKAENTSEIFNKLKIASESSYENHLNKYNVIFLNMQNFLSYTHNAQQMIEKIQHSLCIELLEEVDSKEEYQEYALPELLSMLYEKTGEPYIFIIDEWDCIFREKKETIEGHKIYLDFLRNLLKDRSYVALTYMTGILPIKKYGSHSALNMFTEFSMTNPRMLSEFVGFTQNEVVDLCEKYNMDFAETARWYDGYTFKRDSHVYSPKSVVDAMLNREFDSYWTQTETYEALKVYIEMNFDGLRDAIIEMLAGEHVKINIATFGNDMTTFHSKDDVLTLLVHLGYLAYDGGKQEVFIPNYEVSREFTNAIQGAGWDSVIQSVRASEQLLENTWNKKPEAVASALREIHMQTSILTYNDENALACLISLAYYSAKTYYTEVRELPTGEGFADIVYIPRKNHLDKPAMIVELKWDKTAYGAISQMKDKKYVRALEEYSGNLLLVGINYDAKKKVHECKIEEWKIG